MPYFPTPPQPNPHAQIKALQGLCEEAGLPVPMGQLLARQPQLSYEDMCEAYGEDRASRLVAWLQ